MERQAAGRLISSLESTGLVMVSSHAGRRTGVSLTEDGELWMRAMTGAWLMTSNWQPLKRIAALTEDGWTNAGCVLEVDILGTDYDKVVSDDLTDLEDKLSPFLIAGLLDSHSDLQGRVGYGLTDEGEKALSGTKPRWLPKPDEDLTDFCLDVYFDALADRQTWRTEKSHVLIPLRAGSWANGDAKEVEGADLA